MACISLILIFLRINNNIILNILRICIIKADIYNILFYTNFSSGLRNISLRIWNML